jgi:hypothetical protein
MPYRIKVNGEGAGIAHAWRLNECTRRGARRQEYDVLVGFQTRAWLLFLHSVALLFQLTVWRMATIASTLPWHMSCYCSC